MEPESDKEATKDVVGPESAGPAKTKQCRVCYQAMPAKSRKCVACGSWQSRVRRFFDLFGVATLGMLTGLVAVVGTVGPSMLRMLTPQEAELSGSLIQVFADAAKPRADFFIRNSGREPGALTGGKLEYHVQKGRGSPEVFWLVFSLETTPNYRIIQPGATVTVGLYSVSSSISSLNSNWDQAKQILGVPAEAEQHYAEGDFCMFEFYFTSLASDNVPTATQLDCSAARFLIEKAFQSAILSNEPHERPMQVQFVVRGDTQSTDQPDPIAVHGPLPTEGGPLNPIRGHPE